MPGQIWVVYVSMCYIGVCVNPCDTNCALHFTTFPSSSSLSAKIHLPLMKPCPGCRLTSSKIPFSINDLNSLTTAALQLGSARASVELLGKPLEIKSSQSSSRFSETFPVTWSPKCWGALQVLLIHLVVFCLIKSSTAVLLSVTFGAPSSVLMFSSDSPWIACVFLDVASYCSSNPISVHHHPIEMYYRLRFPLGWLQNHVDTEIIDVEVDDSWHADLWCPCHWLVCRGHQKCVGVFRVSQ